MSLNIEFREFDGDFYARAQEYLAKSNYRSCESCYADQIGWGKVYHTSYAEIGGFYVIKYNETEESVAFSAPMGAGDVKSLIGKLKSYCDGRRMEIWSATDECIELLNKGGVKYEATLMRDRFDYIYLAEKLSTLSGKKLHGKRNHLSRFKKMYNYAVEEITPDNIDVARKLNYLWCEKSGACTEKSEENEFCAFRAVADNFEKMSVRGIILYVDGKPIGYTMGSPVHQGSDTFVVHFEKIATEHHGAYVAINNLFVKSLEGKYKYINREDDMGSEGLRKAKLSYYPDILLEKYNVIIK
ncbi:MAG: DUF2156 domain-containing protein [Clostridia bacterium]|nr:DUF2156 domain-containing protein [Clostridia bacterium]